MFGVYALLAALVAVLAAGLSPAVEAAGGPPEEAANEFAATGVPPGSPYGTERHSGQSVTGQEEAAPVTQRATPGWRQRLLPPLGRSRGVVLRLAALFSVDALAGGLVTQSLMALFFHLRYGVPLAPLAALFFGANTLAALSFLAAAPLARRFGLLNTMVFSHLPSNVLLALVPLMPTFPLAAAVLLLRQLLSQMDVPTRQAYTMALVAPEERTGAASVTSLARSAGSSTSPVFSGLLLQGPTLALGLPFLIAGALKAAYDLALWEVFRGVKVGEAEKK